MKKALVIDDDPSSSYVLGRHLRSFGVECEYSNKIDDAIIKLSSQLISIVFLDLYFGDDANSGMSFLKYRLDHNYKIPVIVLSCHDNITVMTECFKLGAASFLIKPVHPGLLKKNLERII